MFGKKLTLNIVAFHLFKMINTVLILSLLLFTIPSALSEFTSSNITCALCLIGANEIEAIVDYGLDEELMVGYLIQVSSLS